MAIGKIKRLSRRSLITLGLEASHFLSKIKSLCPSSRAGFIFTMHHVRPANEADDFQPNGHLEITPEFLAEAIELLIHEGFDFIRLRDLPFHLAKSRRERPFAIFTLDDGYTNNRDFALPIFERYQVPATIYITPAFAERTGIIWWEVLERLIRKEPALGFDFGRGIELLQTGSLDEKIAVFNHICKVIGSSDEAKTVEFLDLLAREHGIDPLAITKELTLSRDEIAALSDHPLIDLGAHGQNHLAIGRLPPEEARQEISQSVTWLEQVTGKKPQSFAFPYGNRAAAGPRDFKLVQELGLELAVTTRPGMIRTDRVTDLSALPRVSLNGYYQKSRYVAALSSGIPFRWT